ncbi:unnamed protein product [Caenorhabditis auriculariae]|uniref:Uncharacterized protein n=1 Tax=Caenorhabditis auriculariae TaxID=2777116 RepID=A0A8S1HJG8_9PELO|nr:unnamed protein product [Caenorhabditis auriculariae]
MAQNILTMLDDDMAVIETQMEDLDQLYRTTGLQIALEVQRKAQKIRYECLRLNNALLLFQHNCRYDMIYALMAKELKSHVGCVEYAVSQIPDIEDLREKLYF